jgi:hypothetical protein
MVVKSLEKKRKKKEKKVKSLLRKYQRLKEYPDISHQGRCQILLKNKPMNKIGLCKQGKMLWPSILIFPKIDLSRTSVIH